jgi:hypothetical protein
MNVSREKMKIGIRETISCAPGYLTPCCTVSTSGIGMIGDERLAKAWRDFCRVHSFRGSVSSGNGRWERTTSDSVGEAGFHAQGNSLTSGQDISATVAGPSRAGGKPFRIYPLHERQKPYPHLPTQIPGSRRFEGTGHATQASVPWRWLLAGP